MFYNQPIFFERNRVRRVYTGGRLFADFFGDEAVDGYFPEEWVASYVHALNKDSSDPHEGVSRIEGTDIYFDEALARYRAEMLGDKAELGILTKLIDSSVRLPIQAHPDKAFSRKYFDSSHGKEESWIIIAARPGAKVFFGFRDGVTLDDFKNAIDGSEQKGYPMEALLNSIDVKPGDVFYIPAKFVHAIGAGCMLLEVQEPTDFTIQPERWCGDYKLSDKEMYLGISPENALDCFDIGKKFPAPLETAIVKEEDGLICRSAVNDSITDSFKVNIITLDSGSYTFDKQACVYVVTEGCGKIKGDGYERDIAKGDYFFIPAAAASRYCVTGSLKITECYS